MLQTSWLYISSSTNPAIELRWPKSLVSAFMHEASREILRPKEGLRMTNFPMDFLPGFRSGPLLKIDVDRIPQ